MSKETTRRTLLETGKRIFLERGYSNAGIETILQAAGVPKGSFYYYFGSKEEFGLEVLSYFAAEIVANFERCQADATKSPLERLRAYFEDVCVRLESRECRNGCLVGNLSQETGGPERSVPGPARRDFQGTPRPVRRMPEKGPGRR